MMGFTYFLMGLLTIVAGIGVLGLIVWAWEVLVTLFWVAIGCAVVGQLCWMIYALGAVVMGAMTWAQFWSPYGLIR